MKCLTQLVGFDDCEIGTEPFKVNHYLSKNQLDELLTDGYSTVDAWVTATKNFAAQRLATDVISHVNSGVYAETLLENNIAGKFNDGKRETTATNFAGIKIEFWDHRAYVKLVINKISFYGDFTGNIDFLVYDLINGEQLSSTTVSVQAGKISSEVVNIEVPIGMRDRDLAVVYNASAITSYKTSIAGTGCTSCGNSNSVSRYATFSGVNLESPFLTTNGTARNDTAGLSIDFSWVCDQSQWVCSLSGLLGLAMLYKTCYELLRSSLHSGSQFSNQQTTNFEINTERMADFEYNYGLELNKALKHARTPDNICFQCNPKIGVRNILPG